MLEPKQFSFLWSKTDHSFYTLSDRDLEDLNLQTILNQLFKSVPYDYLGFMKTVPNRSEDIVYRQSLLRELIEKPHLYDAVYAATLKCQELADRPTFAYQKEAALYNLLNRMDIVAEVMAVMEHLSEVFSKSYLKSDALNRYRDLIRAMIDHPLYESLRTDVRYVKEMQAGLHSVKIGVNLDENLTPASAMLLSFHESPFTYTRFLKKTNKMVTAGVKSLLGLPRRIFFPDTVPMPNELNRLEKMMEPAMRQLIIFCDQFTESLVLVHAKLFKELPYYDMGIKLFHHLSSSGFPVCQPTLDSSQPYRITKLYNMNLAAEMIKRQSPHTDMVYNDLYTESAGTVFILTGANRGGKTTFTQALGQLSWLSQLGFFVPAASASIKVFDRLLIHFPKEENLSDDYGRLGQECQSFAALYNRMTEESLLLMNESFSGTSHLESLTIATEVVKSLMLLGGTTLFNTHLHELGAMVETLSAEFPDALPCISLVAGSPHTGDNFKISPGQPLGKSYAHDIALRYGMTFEQLMGS